MPGPTSSGFKPPSEEKYKCPVKNCKTEPKGYDISKHFQNCANLKALDRAVANQSTLRKTLLSAPGNVVEKSEEFLSTIDRTDLEMQLAIAVPRDSLCLCAILTYSQ